MKKPIPRVNSRMLQYTPDQFCDVLNRVIDYENTNTYEGGGSSAQVNVVQSTGQSTTDVMSQNAVTNYLAGKVNKESGKGLSSNDFTDPLKTKLENLTPGGEPNIIEIVKRNTIDLPVTNKAVNVSVPEMTSDLINNSNYVADANYVHTDQNFTSTLKDKLDGVESGAQVNAQYTVIDANYVHTDNNYTSTDKIEVGKIDDIEALIPSQATSVNQLADKDFVNSSLNSVTAYYITKNAQGDPFATKAELTNASVYYSGGEVRVPTRNDYCIVLADESKTDPDTGETPTTRYIYQTNGWEFQYVVNNTTLTAAQLAAVNSGITAAKVSKLDGIDMATKQDVLTAGSNIQISGSTISATDTTYSAGTGISIDSSNVISSTSAAQVQSDWAQADTTAVDYIKNKPGDIVYWENVGQVQAPQPWIETTDIKDEAITTAKIDDDAVTTAKIDDDAITTAKILDGAVTAAKLDEHAVIIDKVSDTNGYCLKFADGTMIACQKFKKTVSITTGWGSCYAGVVTPPDYAVAFVSAPTVSISINGYGAAGDSWVASKNGESESTFLTRCGQFNLVRPTSSNSVSAIINIIAFGRWKA